MKETVVITGIAGFIGSHVAKHCIDLGFEVIGIDDMSGGFTENVPNDILFYQNSTLDVDVIERIFNQHKPKMVYHLAADARENLSHFAARHTYMNNVIGSANIINACVNHDVKCLVFTSSIAVMANGIAPYTENEQFSPADPYGNAKACVEVDLHHALEMFGLNYIVFRPFNVYGPGQNIGDKYRNVIGIFMNQIMNGQDLTVFGDGKQTRAFSYIDDVAKPIAMSVLKEECYNQVFYIGGDRPFSINHLIEVISAEFQVTPKVKYLQERHEAKNAWALTEKARQVFGPTWVPLELGIRKMAEWAKKVGPRKSKEFEHIEIRKNLPEGW